MKNIFILAVTLFMFAASMTSRAGAQNANGFVGLWEAVDSLDGSHLILSITNNNNGTFKLLVYDSYFTTCDGGRGIAQGTGTVSATQTLKSDDYTITCFESNKTTAGPIVLTINSDGTLSRVGSEPLTPLIIYHQTGK